LKVIDQLLTVFKLINLVSFCWKCRTYSILCLWNHLWLIT